MAFLVMIISFQGTEAITDAARTYTLQKLRPGTNRPGASVTHPEETLTFTFDDDGYAVFEITPLSRPSYYVKFINADDEIEVEGFITSTAPAIYVGELTGEYTVVCLYTGASSKALSYSEHF